MITYFDGTVFNTDADAIVNTINCLGVMNAGVALEFGLRYPDMLKDYAKKCKDKEISVGHVYYYQEKDKTIVNFSTKWHFKYPSKLEWIESGLIDFVNTYKKHNIKSVAFTKLGTLNGGLDWNQVKCLMEQYLSKIDIPVYICLDNKNYAEGLEKQMLDIFNNIKIEDLKNYVRLTTQQQTILKNNMPVNRFWKIGKLDKIGTTTYKNIYKFCKSQINKQKIEQISLFD